MKQKYMIEIEEASSLLAQSLADWFFTRTGRPTEPALLREVLSTSLKNIAETQRAEDAKEQRKAAMKNMRERLAKIGQSDGERRR